MKTSVENAKCKVCGSYSTIRDGKAKNGQKWKCKVCGRKFVDNHARYGMKTPFVQVQTAIQMYYQGLSLNTICRYLQQEHNNYASVSTVYEWVVKYTHNALLATRNYHPDVGDTWVAVETCLNILGKQVWIFDIIDIETHFLLASKGSFNRGASDAQTLMRQAIQKALKTPKVVIADTLVTHLKGSGYPIIMVDNPSSEIEDFHRTLQWRNGLMSDLKKLDKVFEFVDGWLIYYNYFRRQESLGGKTPSEIANVRYMFVDKIRLGAS